MADRHDDERRFRGGWQDPARPGWDSEELRAHRRHVPRDLVGLHDLDDLSDLRAHYREHRRPYREGAPRPMGHGPKGYQRSDSRIREDICDRLMLSWMDSENVEVLVLAGEVTLQGTVRSREQKRAIEAVAESVLGVKDILDMLRVDRGEQASGEARPEPPGEQPLHS